MSADEIDLSMANMFQMMMGGAMADMGIGGSNLSQCAEGDWIAHPTGGLFRAVKNVDCISLSVLLQQEDYIDHMDDWE